MTALMDALSHIIDLWPLFMLAFLITAAGVKILIRAEMKAVEAGTNKKLFNDDGSLIYMPRNEYKIGLDTMVSDFNDRCEHHQDACRSMLCLKMDGVITKLDKMDEQRNEARKESIASVDKHSIQIEVIGKDVSNLLGRFDTLEKTVIRNGNGNVIK
jgi:hypothetical protein